MSDIEVAQVPIGPRSPQWTTVRTERTVLIVVHSITAMNRLDDIISVFDSDYRIQLTFTFPNASVVVADINKILHQRGYLVMPWSRATSTDFDLAVSAHHSGDLEKIISPTVLVPHGAGHSKYRSANSVYGLGPEWLVRDGHVFPAALILSHKDQYAILSSLTPDALGIATVAGDPCFDRIKVSLSYKDEYRRILSADLDRTVVVVSSTWGPESLFGSHPEFVTRLAAELNGDDYTVCLILHPNVWYAHGPGQIRMWLREAQSLGLQLIPPVQGWQQCILAAHVVIGDGGSVTAYAAAAGTPTVLATFARRTIVPGSPIDALGKLAPKLHLDHPLAEQVHRAKLLDVSDFSLISDRITSAPDLSATLLRRLLYRLMRLQEPDYPAKIHHFSVANLSRIINEQQTELY